MPQTFQGKRIEDFSLLCGFTFRLIIFSNSFTVTKLRATEESLKSHFCSINEKSPMKKFQFLLSVFIVIHLSLGVILADPSSSYNNDKSDNNDKSEPVNVDYKNGSIAAYNGKFLVAIKHLERATRISPNNPDVYNLLGYSHRKLDKLEQAFDNYRKALKLDSRHLGANEYIGELYLRNNSIKKAEEHLEVLDDVCLFGCDEYDNLKDAIEKYKKSR